MENTIGQRIKELRTHYNLGVKEFANRSGLSHVAIFHLESGKTLRPHKSSMQRIAVVFGTSTDWILYGKNEMLPNGTKDLADENTTDSYWKETAYVEVKNKNALLEKEIERLWQIISHFTSGTGHNYPRMMEAG